MCPYFNQDLKKLSKSTFSPKIKTILPLSLILFFFITSCVFFDNKISISNKNVDRTKVPELVIQIFTTSTYKEGNKLWTLTSSKATSFQDNPIIQLITINFESYNHNKNTTNSSAISDSGFVNNNTQDLTLLSNTVIINNEGTKVSGNYFFWDNATKRFTSPQKVTIEKKDGSVISGIGFTADQALGNIRFDKQVSGQISDDKEKEDNFFDGF